MLSGERELSLHGGTLFFVVSCCIPVVFHRFPCQGEGGWFPPETDMGYPCYDRELMHRSQLETPKCGPQRAVGGDVNLQRVGFCSRRGHIIRLHRIPSPEWRSVVFWLPSLYRQDDG